MNNFAKKLKDYRTSASLSVAELAFKVGVSRQTIHKYEQNQKKPSLETIRSISKALKVPVVDLIEDNEIQITLLEYREKEKVSLENTKIMAFQEHYKSRIINFLELKKLIRDEYSFNNPLAGLEITKKRDAEKAAKKLRKKWNLGFSSISSVVDLIEDNGILVIESDIDESFTGLSGWANSHIPFVVINENCNDITRLRFTVLHELGHILLDFNESIDYNQIEKLCNHFAGAVLLVEEVLYQEIKKNRTAISISELKQLKEKYGLSIKAIIYRIGALGLISRETSYKLWDNYDKWYESYGKEFFGEFVGNERPKKFFSLIVHALNEQLITEDRAAELSRHYVDELPELLGGKFLSQTNEICN